MNSWLSHTHVFTKIADASDDSYTPYWMCLKCPELRTRRGATVEVEVSIPSNGS